MWMAGECKINCVKIFPETSGNDEPERSSWVKMFGLDAGLELGLMYELNISQILIL